MSFQQQTPKSEKVWNESEMGAKVPREAKPKKAKAEKKGRYANVNDEAKNANTNTNNRKQNRKALNGCDNK